MTQESEPTAPVEASATDAAVSSAEAAQTAEAESEAAVAGAVVSAVEASRAQEAAAEATDAAVASVEVSATAAEIASEAAAEVQAVSASLESVYAETRASRAEMGEMRGMFSEMYADWKAGKDAAAAEPQVQEVPVNDTAARESASGGTENSSAGTASQASDSGTGQASAAQESGKQKPEYSGGLRRGRR